MAIAKHLQPIVVTQSYFSDSDVQQPRALASMQRREFGGDARVRYVNPGRLLDVHNPKIAYDSFHLVAARNMQVAEACVPPVLEMRQKP